MTYCVGLTGTIGSGKSTVSHYFSKLGIPVISADMIARTVTEKDQPALRSIAQHFGPQAINSSGELNRRYVRHWIATHPEDRIWLEALLHPLINQEMDYQQQQLMHHPYCLLEIPILKTKAAYLNRILLIKAPLQQQITRVMQRDKLSKEEAIRWLNIQLEAHPLTVTPDDILENNGSLATLSMKVRHLHAQYCLLATT